MKKLLTFLLTALLAFSVGWAATTVTFVAGTDLGSYTSQHADEMSKDGVTISCTSAAFGRTDNYRIYSGSTTTISVESGTITRIQFTNVSGYANTLLTLLESTGSYTNGTWTGSSSEVKFKASAQYRASQIAVTIETGGTPTPTLSVSETDLTLPDIPANESSTSGQFNVSGLNLTGNVTLERTSGSSDFSLSTSSIAPSNGSVNQNVTVTYSGTSTTETSATFSISSSGATTQYITVRAKKATGGGSDSNSYTLVTDAGNLEDGEYVLVYSSGTNYALSNTWNSGYYSATSSNFTLSNNVVTLSTGTSVNILTLTKIGNSYYIKDANGYYVGYGSSTNLARNNSFSNISNNNNYKWNISIASNGNATITNVGTGTRVIRLRESGHDRWAAYSTSNTTGYLDGRLYKRDTNNPRLTVSDDSIDLGTITGGAQSVSGTFTLTGANLTAGVQLSSSNNDFSVSPTTINDANGENTITVTYNGNNATTATATILIESVSDEASSVNVTVTAKRDQVATPTFSPDASVAYTSAQTVTISCPTEDAMIHYTYNGGPEQTGSSPITLYVNSTATIEAYATLAGYVDSDPVTATYTIDLTPTLTVAPTELSFGTIAGDQLTVTTSNLTAGVNASVLNTDYNNINTDKWTVNPNTLGTDGGTMTVNYGGRLLKSDNTVRVSTTTNGVANVDVPVHYKHSGPIYIVTSSTNWDFSDGIEMNHSGDVYSYTLNATTETYLVFTKKVGNDVDWNSGYLFGPVASGDWWLTEESMDTDFAIDSTAYHVVKMHNGTYTITLNAATNKMRIVADVHAPVFSHEGGRYYDPIDVEITSDTYGAHIYYTTDGSDPATSSTRILYNSAITISETTTLKAVAIYGDVTSPTTTTTYTIKPFGGNSFILVEKTADIDLDEDYVLVYSRSNNNTNYAMSTSYGSSYYETVTSGFTLEDKTVTLGDNNTVNVLTLEDAGSGRYFIKDQDGYYLTYSGSGNSVSHFKTLNSTNTAFMWTITVYPSTNEAEIKNVSYSSRFLQANWSSSRYACYETNSNIPNAKLYKRGIASPSIKIEPASMELVIPAGGTSQQSTATVTERNTTETTVVTITGDGASYFNATLDNGTLTVTYNGTATADTPDAATITLTNGTATADLTVSGYRLPVTVTITPADGHTFQGSTVNGLIESNVEGATIEYSFDGTTWVNYNADDGFTATVSTVGGTVTVYARATASNGQTTTAQATYTRVPKTTTCTANIVFAPTSNNGEMSQWSTFVTHIGDGSEYLSSTGSSVSKLWTNQSLAAMRFGSGNYTGELVLALDLTKFETDACKLAKVTINAARYSNDGDNCALKVSTSANSTGVTKNITASEDQFADYVFNFDGDEVSSITIENTSTSNGRVYVHSIMLEYNCGASLEAPAISPASGTYYDPQTVTITTEETGATIYYTTDGSNPADANNENRNQYTGTFTSPFTAGSETTIIAIVEMIEDGETVTSDPTSVTYTWGVPEVVIVPDSRNVASESVTVSMTGTPSGATIYYTTDGNTPTTSSTQYDGAFTVDLPEVGDHVTVNAIAVYNGVTSEMATATYTRVQKMIDVHAPFFSPLEGKEGGYSGIYYGNQTLQIATSTENADIYFVIDSVSGTNPPASVSDPTKSSTHYTGPISMTVGKSYRVKAIAYIGDFVSTISEGYYIIKPFEGGTYVYQNLKDFNENCPTGKTASFVNPVQVVFMSTYQNNGHSAEFCYIRDNTDYACVYFGKNYTGSSHIFKMGDWIDGSQISGKTNIWEENFHIQLGTSYHEVNNWPSEALGWSEIIPETTTCQQISSGTAEGDNLWGHYIHARYTTIEGVEEDSDGKYKGTINDQSGVDTYYDKFYRWSGFTNSLGDYDQTFFSTKKNAGATFDVYGIVDYYASDYPKAFQVCPIDFLWIYKPVITPGTDLNCTSEQVVEITVTTPEWVEEGVTPTIYYKTDDMDDWAEYSGPFVVNSNTHVQAYAELESRYDDMMRSVVVETEYKFIGIKDPEIDPASMVIEVITGNEKVEDIMISDSNDANSGAVTVYTTDGTMPSATNGTQIAAGGIVELDPITETTTVTAISYLPDGEGNPVLWSNPVTVTYTFVKSNGVVYDLVDAVTMDKVYVIVNKDAYMGLSTAQNGNNRGSTGVKFKDDSKTKVYGNDELALFVLESANAGRYYFKNINGNGYLTVTTNDVANLSTSATASSYSEAAVAIGSQAAGCPATITFNYDGTNRYLRYFAKGRTFTTNSDVTLNQDVFLYGTTATPLAVIESKITAGDDVQVTVADNLIGAWAINKPDGEKYLWAKDMGLSIDKTAPVAGQKDYVKNILHYQKQDWDQSNWVILDFSGLNGPENSPEEFVGKKLTGGTITGKYVDGNNYRIVLDFAPQAVDDDTDADKYPGYNEAVVLKDDPQNYDWGYNTYIPTNFYDAYMNAPYGEGFVAEEGYALGTHAGEKLFFMNPKVQEVVRIWGIYTQKEDGKDVKDVFTCIKPSLENMVNGWGIKGAFAVEWDYNRVNQYTYGVRPSGLGYTDVNKAFMFHAAIVAKSTSGRRANVVGTADDASNMSDRFVIYPLDFKSNEDNVVTGVEELNVLMKDVESVRYYNIMGMESEKPFEGINIVVTRYTDGSTSTAKILR